jgi:hypothetical protein
MFEPHRGHTTVQRNPGRYHDHISSSGIFSASGAVTVSLDHRCRIDWAGEGDRQLGLQVEAVERVQHVDVVTVRRAGQQPGLGRSTRLPWRWP